MTQPIARNRIAPPPASGITKGPPKGTAVPKGKTPAKPVAKGAAAPEPKVDNQRRYIIAGVSVFLVLLLGYWWCSRSSAQMGRVREMQKELFATPADKMSPEERKARFDALRAEREKLSESEQKALRQEVGQEMQKKRNAEAVAYLKMSQAERMKLIDQKIAREQTSQKNRPAPNGGGGPTPNGVMASANSGGVGGPGGPGGGQKTINPEDRDNRRRSMLLNVSPEARAGMDQMRVDMAQRRAQRGLPPSTGRGAR